MSSHEHPTNPNVYIAREDVAEAVAIYEAALSFNDLRDSERFGHLHRGDHEYFYVSLQVPKAELDRPESEFYGWQSCRIQAPLAAPQPEFRFIFEETRIDEPMARRWGKRTITLCEDGRVKDTEDAMLGGEVTQEDIEASEGINSMGEEFEQLISQNELHHLSHLLHAAIQKAKGGYPPEAV